MKYDSLVKSHPLILVDFYAGWCGPCKHMILIFEDLKKELDDKVKIVKINTETNYKLSVKINIRSIPTIIFYKYGKVQWQQAGGMQLTLLKEKIQPFL